MTQILIPARSPESWKSLLADPEAQWKTGFSARALAHSWQEADGFPRPVARLLKSVGGMGTLEPLLILPEHKTPLAGGTRPSQSDVWVLARSQDGLVSITVEGKAEEPFGPTVGEWLKGASTGKRKRIEYLAATLGLTLPVPPQVRYQLLHRAATAVIEAERFGAVHAVLVVHSFSQADTWFADFEDFARLFNKSVQPGQLVSLEGARVPLHAGWARGEARFLGDRDGSMPRQTARTSTTRKRDGTIRVTPRQLQSFRKIRDRFGMPDLPGPNAWRARSDDDIWIRVVSQVVVVGRAEPADQLWDTRNRRRIAWSKLRRMSDEAAAQAIWAVLRDIGARYAGRDWRSCKKTKALVRNLNYLNSYAGGPKGFLRDVATMSGESRAKVDFVAANLNYIKSKGARDFLTSGFGLVKNHIPLDSRVLGALRHIGLRIPTNTTSSSEMYARVEADLIRQVCRPLRMTGADLDQLLFLHYKEIINTAW